MEKSSRRINPPYQNAGHARWNAATLPVASQKWVNTRKLKQRREREKRLNICRINISCTKYPLASASSTISSLSTSTTFNPIHDYKKLCSSFRGVKKGYFEKYSMDRLLILREKFRFLVEIKLPGQVVSIIL